MVSLFQTITMFVLDISSDWPGHFQWLFNTIAVIILDNGSFTNYCLRPPQWLVRTFLPNSRDCLGHFLWLTRTIPIIISDSLNDCLGEWVYWETFTSLLLVLKTLMHLVCFMAVMPWCRPACSLRCSVDSFWYQALEEKPYDATTLCQIIWFWWKPFSCSVGIDKV